jgi:membrane protein DedA with SNARE-associated domain
VGWSFVLVGAIAATTGRLLLGKLSQTIIRRHWLSEAARKNVDTFKMEMESRPKLTFGLFLFYAFTPLPSNYLFIAYGLTTMPLVRLAAPFLVGRFVSYSIWTLSGIAVSQRLELDGADVIPYASLYFILTQIAFVGVVYAFTHINWALLLQKRKIKWLPK